MKKRLLFSISVLASFVFAASQQASISTAICDLYNSIQTLVPILSMFALLASPITLLLGAGIAFYAHKKQEEEGKDMKKIFLLGILIAIIMPVITFGGILLVILAPAILGAISGGDVSACI